MQEVGCPRPTTKGGICVFAYWFFALCCRARRPTSYSYICSNYYQVTLALPFRGGLGEAFGLLHFHSPCFHPLPAVPPVAHMQPACACLFGVFEQELVVGEVLPGVLVDFLAHLLASRVYVGGFAVEVLRVGRASGEGVHFRATVAAGDAQHAEAAAQWFEHVAAESTHVLYVSGLRGVVNAVLAGNA